MKCPHCDSQLPPNSRFCSQCGGRIEEETGSTDSRRKVTIFFSDISGYTAMSERLDPEEVKELMAGIFSRAAAIVKKHGGHLDKFIGDCVMAVFGLEATREDDGVRALRAALEIHEAVATLNTDSFRSRIGRDLAAHTGMNTGVVVAGDLDLEKGTEKVLGDTVNVASRLCSAARPGEVVVGRGTVHETDRHFEFEDLGTLDLKGKREGVPAYRLKGAREGKPGTTKLRGRRADFTGRGVEMKRLTEALQMAKTGEQAWYFVRGEAGSGKSRLAEEVCRIAEADGVRVLTASCFEYTQGNPYSLWTDFFAGRFGLNEKDSPDAMSRAIEAGCVGLSVEGRAVAPFIAKLFALESEMLRGMDAGFLKRCTEKSIVAVISATCADKPPLLVLDDLHWADPSSLEVLPLVLRGSAGLSLCLARPSETLLPVSSEVPAGVRVEELVLEPLGRAEGEGMLRSLLDGCEAPPELLDFVSLRMKGNPFYIEETVNDLVERGILSQRDGCWSLSRSLEDADIPSTVQGVISARIDRLEPGVRRILQAASVIGQNFYHSILGRLEESETLDTSLVLLKGKDLIRELRMEPDLEYVFKHALMREVVYDSILRKERRRLHERVAVIMEELFSTRVEEFYESIAHHFRQSENVERAIFYLMKAGKKSLNQYAAAESNSFYKGAYELLTARPLAEEDRTTLVRLLNEWGLVQYYFGDFLTSVALHERHASAAEALRDAELTGMFWAWFAYALTDCLRFDVAIKAGERAVAIGREAHDARVTCYSLLFLGNAHMYASGFRKADPFLVEALALAAQLEGDGYALFKCLQIGAWNLAVTGQPRAALAMFEREIEFGIRHCNSRAITLGYIGKATMLSDRGRYVEAERLFLLAFDYARDDSYLMLLLRSYCIHSIRKGDFSTKGAQVEKLASLAKNRDPVYSMIAEGLQAVSNFMQGRFTLGFRQISQSVDAFRASDSPVLLATGLHILGNIYSTIVQSRERVAPDILFANLWWIITNVPFAFGKAKRAFREALVLARKAEGPVLEAQIRFDLGILYKARGKRARAEEWFCTAEAMYAGMDEEYQLGKVREELIALRAR
jgi:class 3 adenylate cyclase/tetratricopeptide (TPR) repeat protein